MWRSTGHLASDIVKDFLGDSWHVTDLQLLPNPPHPPKKEQITLADLWLNNVLGIPDGQEGNGTQSAEA